MNTTPKLELKWIEIENRLRLQPRLHLRPARVDRAVQDSTAAGHEAALDVCCNARCDCVSVLLQFQPPLPTGDLWLDLNDKKLIRSSEQEIEPEFSRLEGIIHSELSDADFLRLREWYFAEKLEVIETTPVSQHDIANLPNLDDGRMVGFTEVFPCGLSLNFTAENEAWAVDEQYCVQPDCRCSETVLSFLKLKDETGKTTASIRTPPALRYNYRSHAVEVVASPAADRPLCDRLLAALQAAHPNLDAQLELHHLIVQSLYTRHHIQRNKSLLESTIRAVSSRIGRNEPCPCGSGKKFKHCCLNKSAA